MIPILFNKTESEFLTNGLGRLADCISCVVLEERNGRYECEFQYPIDGVHYPEIKIGRLVYVTHDDTNEPQPFEIYRRSAEINGIVTFYAHHISYRLGDVTVRPYTAGSCVEALNGISLNSINGNPFTFWTDKATVANFKSDVPRNARNMLGGEQNSILDVFGGGDYEFDKFTVKLHAERGTDSGVVIAYSKNMTDLRADETLEGSYNAVVPFWTDTEGNLVTLPEEMIIYSGLEPVIDFLTDHNGVIIRTHNGDPIEVAYEMVEAVPMDLSDAFEEAPTVSQLRDMARARFERSQAWLADETIDVDFVHLWQTEEYKDYAALQRVRLCDTVSVYYKKLGVDAVKKKVVKTVYNVLLDRYDSIELGTPSVSLAQAIERTILENVPTTSMMESAIKYATDMIRGGLGGYVVMTAGPNGYPQEILIMDTPDINTAVNVWRFNQGGLGHSHSGYDGPFDDIALTQDGRINASMITTGSLNANYIKAGTITDETGNNYWNLSAGQLVTTQGRIGNFDISDGKIYYESSVRRMEFSDEHILWKSTYTDGNTYGVRMEGDELAFLGKRGRSTWNLDDLAILRATFNTGGTTHNFSIRVPDWNHALIFGTDWNLWLSGFDLICEKNLEVQKEVVVSEDISVRGAGWFSGNLTVYGSKSRSIKTKNYNERLQYCYETPTPLFGDIGEAVLDAGGICYVEIDDIFTETIAEKTEYQVFLQKEGQGDCYIAEKTPRYFVIQGTPNLKVAWELKAKQRDYENIRLEQSDLDLDEYENTDESDNTSLLDSYITEQEGLLYGYN